MSLPCAGPRYRNIMIYNIYIYICASTQPFDVDWRERMREEESGRMVHKGREVHNIGRHVATLR